MRNIFKLSDGKFVKEAATLVGSPGISVFTIPGTSFRIDPMEIMRDVVKVLYSDINRAGIKKINVSSIPVSNILGLAKYQPRKENGVYVDSERDTIHVDVKKIFENYFLEQEEIGASFAIYREGKPLIDLWNGFKNKNNK